MDLAAKWIYIALTLLLHSGSVSSSRERDSRNIFWKDLQRITQCGIAPRKTGTDPDQIRILRGQVVPEKEFWPWMAYLYLRRQGRKDGFICGGTLIHKQWVLTAAHCLQLYNQPREYGVVLGENDVHKDSGLEKDIMISKIIKHPDYSHILLTDDIALLKLKSSIRCSDHIRPACLPPTGFETDATVGEESLAGDTCIALGWGLTERGRKSEVLRKVGLTIMPRILCIFSTFGRNARLYVAPIQRNSTQFCAVGRNGKDTCNGDSGGPLLCYNKDSRRYFLHGITSYGPQGQCGRHLLPAIYTQVSKYHRWIARKMQQGARRN